VRRRDGARTEISEKWGEEEMRGLADPLAWHGRRREMKGAAACTVAAAVRTYSRRAGADGIVCPSRAADQVVRGERKKGGA